MLGYILLWILPTYEKDLCIMVSIVLVSCQSLACSSVEGNGTPLQYSCLENPMDGGAWWAAVHGVTKSQT